MYAFYLGENMAVVVFKTKTDVFRFVESCTEWGLGAKIVTIPREIKIGCGLSVEIASSSVQTAKNLIRYGGYSSFNGIFIIKRINAKSIVQKL